MNERNKYYVVTEKAVPEVFRKVLEAKRLLDSGRASTVQEASDQVGISRSSFYKYKDDIFPFCENARGTTVSFLLQMDDEPGALSSVLQAIASYDGNILTIHQGIPINGIASLTISVQIASQGGDAEEMMHHIENQRGVHYFKILGRE